MCSTVPQELADVIESLFATVLISDGFRPEGVQTMFDRIVRPFCDNYIRSEVRDHPKTLLTKMFQARGCRAFAFEETKVKSTNVTRYRGMRNPSDHSIFN